jgi:WD40 repeat protein
LLQAIAMKYEAFLSYARVPDLALATALESGLQSFAKSWNRVRAIDVFRDQTNLSSIGGLASGVTRALDESGFFILLACPESARSYWVRQEITHWLKTKSSDTIVLVLTGGSIDWPRNGNDFNWEKTTAFPEILRGRFSEEPLWLDLTWAAGIEQPTMLDARFLNVVGDISAIVRGIPKDQLIGEDVRQHRKLLMLQRAAVAALAVLAITAGAAAVLAQQQRNRAVVNADRAQAASEQARRNQALAERNEQRAVVNEKEAVSQRRIAEERRVAAEAAREEAERQREQATLQRNRAISRALASAALLAGSEDVQLALNLALEAVKVMPTEESAHALRRALIGARAVDPDSVGEIYWEGSRIDSGEPIGDAIRPFLARSARGSTLNSPDGRRSVSIGTPMTIRETIDARPRTLILNGHTDSIEAVAFDPTGRFIVSGAQDMTVRVWDALTGQLLDVFPHDGQVVQVAFNVDGTAIIAHSRRTRRAWETRLGRSIDPLALAWRSDDHILAVKLNDLVLSPQRDWAAVWGWHGTVVTRTASLDMKWIATDDSMAPVFSPDNRDVALSGMKGVTIYRLATRSPRLRLETGAAANVMAYNPDGKLLATSLSSGTVDVWDTVSGKRTARLPLGQRATALAFDRQSNYIAVAVREHGMVLWDLKTGKLLWSLPLAGRIQRIAFGAGARWLVFVPDAAAARVVDVKTGRELATLNHREEGLIGALSPGNTHLALGSKYTFAPTALGSRAPVTLWNLASLAPTMQPERTLVAHSGIITSVDFSPDGRWLATGGLDDAVLVWDLSAGEVIDTYRRSHGGVFRAVFTADSRHIIVADREANVALHDCVPCGDLAPLVEAAQARIVRPLTVEQRRRYVGALTAGQ